MFYHSFPRPKPGQNSIKKGLAILESFLKNGILMVPETVFYKRDTNDQNKTPEEYFITQSRFCLTEIDIGELKAHEKYFGCFHLEFTNQKTYALGAMPVFYLPRTEPGIIEWPLKKLAAGYLYRLFDLQTICRYIQNLDGLIKNEKDGSTIPINVHNKAVGKTETYSINVKQLRDLLEMITQNILPDRYNVSALMDDLLGALQGVSSLFYPTDKDYEGEYDELYYFRQREWRITAGIGADGKPLCIEPDKDQIETLMSIDSSFFDRKIICATGEEIRRIEGCFFMPEVIREIKPEPGDKEAKSKIEMIPVQRFVERIIVPKEVLEQAKDIANKYNFESSRIVDFESAMKLAISESEYELVKTQCRIQMLKAAIAGW
jgi:hypothetical protein